jgi:hypothetical protein
MHPVAKAAQLWKGGSKKCLLPLFDRYQFGKLLNNRSKTRYQRFAELLPFEHSFLDPPLFFPQQ